MFVKITSGSVDQYPYTVGDLRRDNPNTSFSKTVREATMASFGMYPVGYEAAPDYDPLTHRLQHSSVPSLVDGEWKLTKTVVALTADQIADATAAKAKDARKDRDTRLAETDWMTMRASDTSTPVPSAWHTYRQSLRDISSHDNWPNLNEADWPTEPS